MPEGVSATSQVEYGSLAALAGQRALELHSYLLSMFGTSVTMAIYLAAAALMILLLWRLVKLSFDVVRCVAIPAIAVALVGSWLLPFPFLHIFPIATALFAGVLLVRG
jgi:chromate transport protein ChrA